MLNSKNQSVNLSELITHLDKKAVELRSLRPDRLECPSCQAPLHRPTKSEKDTCPVCRAAKIKLRNLPEGLCPVCHTGYRRVHRQKPNAPTIYCPECKIGILKAARKVAPWSPSIHECKSCHARFSDKKGQVTQEATNAVKSWDEWFNETGRSPSTAICDACAAQFDLQPNENWRLIHCPLPRKPKESELTWQEWTLVANNLPPSAGNAECQSCGADFLVEDGWINLLRWTLDPYHVAATIASAPNPREKAPWTSAGKLSGNPGPTCPRCNTEFDDDGDLWRLAFSEHPELGEHIGESFSGPNWHRIARDLPLVGDEESLTEQLNAALHRALASGVILFDSAHPDRLWRGEIMLQGSTKSTPAVLEPHEFTIGGIGRKRRIAIQDISEVEVMDDDILLTLSSNETVQFSVTPAQVVIALESGKQKLFADAFVLANKIEALTENQVPSEDR